MENQPYSDWSLGVHQRLSKQRIPICGSVAVTQRCNNHCVHCYNNLSAANRGAMAAELTLHEYYRIVDEIVDAGCLWLLLTGGEIFLRQDFLEIYSYAREKGLLITLFTNGTLITNEIAERIAQSPPFAIEITIYGHTRETYEAVTRTPGSYNRCINGINLLRERRLPLKLKTMALTINKHEVQAMKQFVESVLGLEFKFDAMINPRLDFSQSPLDVRLTPAEVVELDLQSPDRVSEWKRFAGCFIKSDIETVYPSSLYRCGAGLSSFSIDPYGKLSPCVLSVTDGYDLRAGNFREGWGSHLAAVRQKKTSRSTKCTDCRLQSLCGICPASSELEGADQETPVDFLCRVAHLRAYALDVPIPPHAGCEYCPGGSQYAEMIETAKKLKGLRTER